MVCEKSAHRRFLWCALRSWVTTIWALQGDVDGCVISSNICWTSCCINLRSVLLYLSDLAAIGLQPGWKFSNSYGSCCQVTKIYLKPHYWKICISFCSGTFPLSELAMVLHTRLPQFHACAKYSVPIWVQSIGSSLCQLQQTGICYHVTWYGLYKYLWFALIYQSMPGLHLGCMIEWWYQVCWQPHHLCSCPSYMNQLEQKRSVHR